MKKKIFVAICAAVPVAALTVFLRGRRRRYFIR